MTRKVAHTASAATQNGLVVGAQRRHFDVEFADGSRVACIMKGRAQRIAVGDRVDVERTTNGGAIVAVGPRINLVYRSDAFKEKLLAANVTQIAAVVAPDVALDEDLINRWMIAAEAANCRYVVFANKADLPGFADLRARLEPCAALGYPVVELTAREDAAPAMSWLAGQHTVLVGQSGMGKSTLINTLVPDADARTSIVSEALNTGKHTTTSTTLYSLPEVGTDSWIVDSPGMKMFGLSHVDPADIAHAFVEIRPHLGTCRFSNCRHDQEPGCAVLAAVDAGEIAPHRLALLHALMHDAETARDPQFGSR